MGPLLPLGSLWVGEELRWLDRLSLQSFVRHGHEVTLFHTHPLKGPKVEGVSYVDAREIFPACDALMERSRPAVLSDIFRLVMMRMAGLAWVDTDVLCLKPLCAQDGYLVGYEHGGMINGAVLALPDESPAFETLLENLTDPDYVPEWLHRNTIEKARAAPEGERLLKACELVPNAIGPRALTHMLNQTGEVDHVLPATVLNPLPWGLVDVAFNPFGGLDGWITESTLVMHLYASRVRALHMRTQPYKGSLVEQVATDCGFDFGDLPARTNHDDRIAS